MKLPYNGVKFEKSLASKNACINGGIDRNFHSGRLLRTRRKLGNWCGWLRGALKTDVPTTKTQAGEISYQAIIGSFRWRRFSVKSFLRASHKSIS